MYHHHHHQGKNIHPSSRGSILPERHLFLQWGNGAGDPGLVPSTNTKPRLKWTQDLHEQFIEVVNQLGGADNRNSVVAIGLNVHTALVEIREKLSIPEAQWPQAISELCALNHIEEAAVLSTCNKDVRDIRCCYRCRAVNWLPYRSYIQLGSMAIVHSQSSSFMRLTPLVFEDRLTKSSGMLFLVLCFVNLETNQTKVSLLQHQVKLLVIDSMTTLVLGNQMLDSPEKENVGYLFISIISSGGALRYDMQFDVKYAYFNFLQSIPHPSSHGLTPHEMGFVGSSSDTSICYLGDEPDINAMERVNVAENGGFGEFCLLVEDMVTELSLSILRILAVAAALRAVPLSKCLITVIFEYPSIVLILSANQASISEPQGNKLSA
ncbi:hypothetical protein TEA_027907 [Camellia sinensis var. sinensis]|uniref:Glutamyl-tRNA reductase N-terminal domain-containing protein n=1 Tax=Camellia sinensis var. sinensis TaxID=542762 RepID=A0A4S4DKR4_CAMSN|nr:hypothetical protein TEA_027907 [Camellia sinensis var. sinensis]